jgi:hypothetical protein
MLFLVRYPSAFLRSGHQRCANSIHIGDFASSQCDWIVCELALGRVAAEIILAGGGGRSSDSGAAMTGTKWFKNRVTHGSYVSHACSSFVRIEAFYWGSMCLCLPIMNSEEKIC